jgi:hypothetical protein
VPVSQRRLRADEGDPCAEQRNNEADPRGNRKERFPLLWLASCFYHQPYPLFLNVGNRFRQPARLGCRNGLSPVTPSTEPLPMPDTPSRPRRTHRAAGDAAGMERSPAAGRQTCRGRLQRRCTAPKQEGGPGPVQGLVRPGILCQQVTRPRQPALTSSRRPFPPVYRTLPGRPSGIPRGEAGRPRPVAYPRSPRPQSAAA